MITEDVQRLPKIYVPKTFEDFRLASTCIYLNSVSYSTPCDYDQLTVYQKELDTNLIPRTYVYSPFKMADRGGGKTISY